jgi:glycosyltransferase involved in cell wall biosynthesis
VASGRWLAFLDSDDQWLPEKLEKDALFLTNNPFFEIMQSDEMWIRNGKRVNRCKHHLKPEGWIFKQCVERCMISPSAMVVKKSLLSEYGLFDENLPVCEDYDLWLKITRRHIVGLNPAETLIKYGGHDDQLSRKFEAMDRFRIISIINMLKDEKDDSIKTILMASLSKRIEILINGASKRGLEKDIIFYKNCLNKAKNYMTMATV